MVSGVGTGDVEQPMSPGSACMTLSYRTVPHLYSLEKLVVLVVWANPEPHDVAFVQNAEGTIGNAHACRVHRTPLTHTLEI